MSELATVGIDLAKSVFQIHGLDESGWGRKFQEMAHDARLMPPSYVKPYVKRGKTDAADAAAICEAVTRPSMRFVAIKTEACSSVMVLHRTGDFWFANARRSAMRSERT